MKNKKFMKVNCISTRESRQDQITVGGLYMIDMDSIWIDFDGDVYGEVYDNLLNRVGQLKLSHFSSVGCTQDS